MSLAAKKTDLHFWRSFQSKFSCFPSWLFASVWWILVESRTNLRNKTPQIDRFHLFFLSGIAVMQMIFGTEDLNSVFLIAGIHSMANSKDLLTSKKFSVT